MTGRLDRDVALEVLRDYYIGGYATDKDALDVLEGCVRPAPAQTIDRDALVKLLDDIDEGDGEIDVDLLHRGLVGLLQPVPLVEMSPQQAAVALQWFDELNGPVQMGTEDRAVAALLAAADRRPELTRPVIHLFCSNGVI